MVRFRNIFVNTLHKGDNKDDVDVNNKFLEPAICRMGTYSLYLEFCPEFRVDIRENVTIFCFRISLEGTY
jgi:hypothetical protein